MTTTEVIRAKKRWERARREAKAAREQMNVTIEQAAAAGVSQAEIARALGWPRQRVNTLLTKEDQG